MIKYEIDQALSLCSSKPEEPRVLRAYLEVDPATGELDLRVVHGDHIDECIVSLTPEGTLRRNSDVIATGLETDDEGRVLFEAEEDE